MQRVETFTEATEAVQASLEVLGSFHGRVHGSFHRFHGRRVYYFREAAFMEASTQVVAAVTGSLEYFHESCRHPCERNLSGTFHSLLPWKLVGACIEKMEASTEVVEASMEVWKLWL